MRSYLKVIFVLMSFYLGVFLLFSLVIEYQHFRVPDLKGIQREHLPTQVDLYAQDGSFLGQERTDFQKRKSDWQPLRMHSKILIEMILKSEDQHFFRHIGVDFFALAATLVQRVRDHSLRGGSTLTMQLVKILRKQKQPDFQMSYLEKLKQIVDAIKIENTYSKEEILETYLNIVPVRGDLIGLSAAAEILFHKQVGSIDQTEAAILSVLLRSPNAHFGLVSQRMCRLSVDLCQQKTKLAAWFLQLQAKFEGAQKNQSHFAQFLAKQKIYGRVQTDLDSELQVFAQQKVKEQVLRLIRQNVHDAAVLVLENKTGKVLAYVGGAGVSEFQYVDGVQAFRQAGSTLKPFLYAQSFQENILTPNSWLDDSPLDVTLPSGSYRPRNHDKLYSGWVQVKTALASSLNIPAVKTVQLLGYEKFWSLLKMMSFSNLLGPDQYGPGIALGVLDVKLWDLTNAFRVLANHGVWSEIQLPHRISAQSKEILSKKSTELVSRILSTDEYRSLTFGRSSLLDFSYPVAVKTGTSKDMRDNWCMGYSQDYTIGVWVGNFNGQPMWDVLGISGAAPIFHDIMEWLHRKRHAKGLILAEEIPQIDSKQMPYPKLKISYPNQGLILATDPNIPAENQKIPLQYSGLKPKEAIAWAVNGKFLASSEHGLWSIRRGKHKIQLFSGSEKSDEVEIIVK